MVFKLLDYPFSLITPSLSLITLIVDKKNTYYFRNSHAIDGLESYNGAIRMDTSMNVCASLRMHMNS